MAPKAPIYETQAAEAVWRGAVDGRPAFISSWKGEWEISCRRKDGMVMFKLRNRAAIRNVAKLASPPIPQEVLDKMLKAAVRDEPIGKGSGSRRLLAAFVLIALLAAAAYAAILYLPGARELLTGR
ncbi:MAG: hypothetical protein ACREID_05670 [Planctomycetota bacterium]